MNFSTVDNLRRHNEAFDQADRTRHQCWQCNKTCLRLSKCTWRHRTKTSKNNNKEPILHTRNPGNQTIEPPTEARPRTLHWIYVPVPNNETSHINKTKQKRRISRLDPFIAVTLDEALMSVTDEKSTIGRLNRLQT